jgi:O-antigen ligase
MIDANDPFLLFCAAAVALCAALLLGRLALSLPRTVLASSYVIVLIAGTKLRVRDASASLTGDFDSQILFELSLYAAVGLVVGITWLARWRALPSLTSPERLLFGYVLLALCSLFWSIVPAFTFIRALQLLILYGLAAISVRVLGSDGAMRAAAGSIVFFVLVCATAAAIGLPGAAAFMKTDYTGFIRFTWFAVHPISAATQAGLATVAVLATAFTSPLGWRDRRYGIPAWLCSGALLAILGLTYSRGPLLATLAAGIVLLLRRLRFDRSVALASAATVAIVAALVVSDNPSMRTGGSDSAFAHAFLRGQDAEQLTGLSGRVELWKAAIPTFLERPVLGNGYHGSRPILLRYASWAGYAHNAFLQTLLDLGITGAFLLWPTIVWVALSGLRPPQHRRGLADQQGFLLATAVFLLVNAVSSESFAGTPGYDILLVFLCTTVASRAWREAAANTGAPAWAHRLPLPTAHARVAGQSLHRSVTR